MAVLYAYYDESYGESGAFSIAGYTFKQSALRPFERDWQRMLDRFSLPFFRMSLCAHGNGPFKEISKPQRIAVQTQAISLIGKYACFGYGISFPERMMNQGSMQRHFGGMEDYEWACWAAMVFARRWAYDHQWPGSIQYLFEAGHKNQSRANKLLNYIGSDPDLQKAYQYGGHSFVSKQSSGAVQAADLLAWQVNKNLKRRVSGQFSRKDFLALTGATHTHMVFAEASDHALDYWLRMVEGREQSIKETLLEMLPMKLVKASPRFRSRASARLS